VQEREEVRRAARGIRRGRKSPAAQTRSAAQSAAGRRRWRRRKEARPTEILEAALAVFAERGFAAARLDDVAARARISKGTLYLYFDSKEALFKAVVRAAIVPNIAQAEAAASGFPGPTADLLAAVLRRLGQVMAETPIGAIPKLMLAEAGNFPDLARFYLKEVIGRGFKLFSGILARGIARGEFRPVEVKDTVRLIIAPMLFIGLWRHAFERHAGERLDAPRFVAQHIDMLLRGLAPVPSAEPRP
jgi:AcrR family transcriptional regulator